MHKKYIEISKTEKNHINTCRDNAAKRKYPPNNMHTVKDACP